MLKIGMKKLILGATGSIGSSLARKIVADGGEVHLVGRDDEVLNKLAGALWWYGVALVFFETGGGRPLSFPVGYNKKAVLANSCRYRT